LTHAKKKLDTNNSDVSPARGEGVGNTSPNLRNDVLSLLIQAYLRFGKFNSSGKELVHTLR